jgi:HK97 family phage prohead protease
MTDDLERRAVAFQLRSDVDGDGRTLEGYAAVFNSPTFISDRLGEYEETVAPGAFKRSINARKPVLQFDHGQHPVLGSIPVGAIEALSEDTRGLFVRARLFDNWMTEPLRDAIREGAIEGMSFRFEVLRDTWEEGDELRKRTMKEIRLYELGPVVFPAYADTTVSLRSLAAHVPGLTLTLADPSISNVAAVMANPSPPSSSTSDEPAAEFRGTSEEPATDTTDPTPPSHSVAPEIGSPVYDHSPAARKQRGRQIAASRKGIGRK